MHGRYEPVEKRAHAELDLRATGGTPNLTDARLWILAERSSKRKETPWRAGARQDRWWNDRSKNFGRNDSLCSSTSGASILLLERCPLKQRLKWCHRERHQGTLENSRRVP
jgi:hypothetical protein